MSLKVERRDGGPERRVVIGCVVSKTVIAAVAARWDNRRGLFASKWSNLIVSWCVTHFRKYGRPPGRDIDGYFREWAEANERDRDTIRAISGLLESLSDEYERDDSISPDHLLDVAAALFEKTHLTDLFDRGRAMLERGEVEKAREIVEASRKIEIGTGAGIDLLTDSAAIEAAFAQRQKPLVVYPGAARQFFGHFLGRDQFVAFLGKPKVGKSRFLLDVAWRMLEQGRNVSYFEMGDLSQSQLIVRFAVRATRRPAEAGRYQYPLKIDSNGDSPIVDSEFRTATRVLTAQESVEVMKELGENPDTGRLKLSCHPSGSLSVSAAEGILDGWERNDDFRPDVVIFDYADLAAPMTRTFDKMEQVNETWGAMRGLSQRLHCLVATATQCNREGFDARILRREHVGGYYMKLAHVTAMYGVNQNSKEKDEGIFRLNCLEGRELDFAEDKVLWCAGCLSVGDPIVRSSF